MDSDFRRKMREKYGLEEPEESADSGRYSANRSAGPKVDLEDDLGLVPSRSINTELGKFGRCARTWLMAVNIVFLIGGLILIAYGVVALESPGTIDELDINFLSKSVTIVALVIASCISLLAIFGIIGARLESLFFLKAYAISLGILLLAQGIVGALVGTGEVKMESLVESSWKAFEPEDRLRIQNDLDCCGLNSYNDSWAAQPCPGAVVTTLAPTTAAPTTAAPTTAAPTTAAPTTPAPTTPAPTTAAPTTPAPTTPAPTEPSTTTTPAPQLDLLGNGAEVACLGILVDKLSVYGAFGYAFLSIAGLQAVTFLVSLGYFCCVRKKKNLLREQPLLLDQYRDAV